jgi:hypothetical protein
VGTEFVAQTSVMPDHGMVTWDSEGTEGGRYHSRKLHVPSEESGLTIGRGYDMKEKTSGTIVNDLTSAGVSLENATTISKAAGKKGAEAKKFIVDNKLEDFEISQVGQKALFEISYAEKSTDAERLAAKQDVKELYGITDWENLDPAILDIIVDMHFRGDYAGGARKKIQKYIVANDLEGFAKTMGDAANWPNVPQDRFNRRKKFLEDAVLAKKEKDKLQRPAQPKTNSFSSFQGKGMCIPP